MAVTKLGKTGTKAPAKKPAPTPVPAVTAQETEVAAFAELDEGDAVTPDEPDEHVTPITNAAPAVALAEPEPEPEPVVQLKYQVQLVRGARYYFKGIIVKNGGVIEVTGADRNHLVMRTKGAFKDYNRDAQRPAAEMAVPDPTAEVYVPPEDPNAPVVVTGAETEDDAAVGANRGKSGISNHGRPVSSRARDARTGSIGV